MRRPRVLANFAMTADGKISTRNGTAAQFTSARDKRRLLEIRALADAVMVGRGTVVKDEMSMTLPDATSQEEREARGQSAQPLRVVVSNSGRLSPDLKLFRSEGAPILLYASAQMSEEDRTALFPRARLYFSAGETVDLGEVLQDLRRTHQVRTVVCEGGPGLLRSLLEGDWVDEVFITLAPVLFGGQEAPTMTGKPDDFLPESRLFRLKAMEVIDGECFTHYVRRRRSRI